MLRALILIPALMLVTFIDFLLLGLYSGRRPYQQFNNKMLKIWSKVTLFIAGVKVEVEGLENLVHGRSSVIVANHMSAFDIVACGYALPVTLRFMAKKELFRVPILGPAMKWFGNIKIDRQNREKAIRSIEYTKELMKQNEIAIIGFPEGTRSLDGKVSRFKKGLFMLAIDTGSPVVPVTIDGSFGILKKGSLNINPGRIRVIVHPPMETANLVKEDRDGLIDRTRDTIIAAMKSNQETSHD